MFSTPAQDSFSTALDAQVVSGFDIKSIMELEDKMASQTNIGFDIALLMEPDYFPPDTVTAVYQDEIQRDQFAARE